MQNEPLIVLDHIQGPLQGSRQVLKRELHGIGTGEHAFVHFPSHRVPGVKAEHAILTRTDDSYQISAAPDAAVFVNGIQVHVRRLAHGDLIRIGESGPLLRYREILKPARSATGEAIDPGYKTVREAISDAVQDAKSGSGRALGTGFRILRSIPREVTSQTAPRARLLVIGSIAVIVLLLGTIVLRLFSLESRLERQAAEIVESVGMVREENRISVEEMREMRDEVATTADRLNAIDIESNDVAETVGRIARSTVFVQASYGFSDTDGRLLRAMLGPDGRPIRDVRGQMLPTFGGEGPVLERQYTGTAFVATGDGLLLTNHHVAEPWLFDEAARDALARGFTPVPLKMVGFLPGIHAPMDVTVAGTSSTSDLALLRFHGTTPDAAVVELSEVEPALGQSVMVIGYPTGIRALLARTDPAFVDSVLRATPEPDFWEMARQLAENDLIAPLVTRGIVGQISAIAVVYDAETTHGASGGPVIGLDGRVIAVNTAIIGDFDGSNLGVPVRAARELLAEHMAQLPD